MIRLEYIGQPGPHRDPERFVKAVRAAKPSLTDDDIVTIVRRGNARFKPRWERALWQVFGADILTDDLTQIEAWSLIEPNWQELLGMFPVEGGQLMPETPEGVEALNMAIQSRNLAGINRRVLMRPPGLSRSYVWRDANAWIQEVADADAKILRETPVLNQCFRNVDQANGPVLVQSYEYGVSDRQQFANFDEFEAFRQDEQRKPTWRGM